MLNRKLTVLYGSQTGTAQDLAEELWRQSKTYYFKGQVKAMNLYNVQDLISEEIVLFVCSTTGQGEEPDNMIKFWQFLLRRSLPLNSLNGVNFAVLGLGDSSYSKFNFVAKRLHKRMVQLGATPVVPIGLCDDQHDLGITAVSLSWVNLLWQKLELLFPLPNGMKTLKQSPRIFRWNINIVSYSTENNSIMPNVVDTFEFEDLENYFDATVKQNIRTTAEKHFQDVRLISFQTNNITWNPGDVFVCRPHNSDEKVKSLFNLFQEHNIQIYPETIIKIDKYDDEMEVPNCLLKHLSMKTIATKYWDLNAIPRNRIFKLLSLNCTNELEKEKLLELTTPESQEDLYKYVNRPRRSVLEVLYDFPHASSKLTLQILFEIFQPIQPRSFSIASSSENNILELLVAVVEYKTILAIPRLGLCSNWLKILKQGDVIHGSIKKGTFILPKNEDIPLIFIAPGTGLAPFRSILLHKEINEIKYNGTCLFFGCRNKRMDFHCKDDLLRLESNAVTSLFCAFSRDQEHKIYVQHVLKEKSSLIKTLIMEKGGYIFLAGSSKNMPQAVKSTIKEIFDDDQMIDKLIKQKRYQEEVWG